MPKLTTSKISKNGQTTIPVEVRTLLGIETGDTVLFTPHKKGFIISKLEDGYTVCPHCQGKGVVRERKK